MSRRRWSLHPGTASPRMRSLPRQRERQVTCARQCERSGDSCLSPRIRIGKEITNLSFIAPAERCKGQELSAASRPIRPLGLATRLGFVGIWKFPASPMSISKAASSSAAGRLGTSPGAPAKAPLRDVVPVPAEQSRAGSKGNRFEQRILTGTGKPRCLQVPRSLLDPLLCSCKTY